MITPGDRRILGNLAKDVYRKCGKTDLRAGYQPLFEADYTVGWLQKDIRRVFDEYQKEKRLSEEARMSLKTHEKAVLDSIPGYVEQRKEELGYKTREDDGKNPKKPSKLKKIFTPLRVSVGIGILVPSAIELYSAVTRDPAPKDALYSGVRSIANKLSWIRDLPHPYFTSPFSKFLVNEISGFVSGTAAGIIAEEVAIPIFTKRKRWKQYKPLHKQIKQQLGV